jgi:hypothetical protein
MARGVEGVDDDVPEAGAYGQERVGARVVGDVE